MKNIRIPIAILAGKAAQILSKFLGYKSSSMPGYIARIIYPNILTYLWKQISQETIIVTGTNGKTTTNNIIRDIFKSAGYQVVCNDLGANMINGITSAFIKDSNVFGNLKATFACLEVDEATFPKLLDELTPNKVVITNLFRDQLDRYGEIDLTAKNIDKGLEKLKSSKIELFLNADDPLTAQFKKHDFPVKFYGIGEQKENSNCDDAREGRFCTFCGEELVYNYYYYSQLGDYYCPNCNFKRPTLDYSAKNIEFIDGFSFDLIYNQKIEHIKMNYLGFYNVYNCLAAISLALNYIDNVKIIQKALDLYVPQIGRMERFNLSKPIILNLAKNPAGFNQTIDAVVCDKRLKNVLVIINDNGQDGHDISWLWDSDFERLANANINKYFVGGIRKEDMAIRFKYGEIPSDNIFIEEDIKKAIFKLIDDDVEIAYILVNYTALFETQNILKNLENVYRTDVK